MGVIRTHIRLTKGYWGSTGVRLGCCIVLYCIVKPGMQASRVSILSIRWRRSKGIAKPGPGGVQHEPHPRVPFVYRFPDVVLSIAIVSMRVSRFRMAPDGTGGSYNAQRSVASLIWQSVRLLPSHAGSASADVRHPPRRATTPIHTAMGSQHYISGNQQ